MVNIAVSADVCMCVCLHTGNPNTYVYAQVYVYIYIYILIVELMLMFSHPTFSIRFTYHFAEVHPFVQVRIYGEYIVFLFSCKTKNYFYFVPKHQYSIITHIYGV